MCPGRGSQTGSGVLQPQGHPTHVSNERLTHSNPQPVSHHSNRITAHTHPRGTSVDLCTYGPNWEGREWRRMVFVSRCALSFSFSFSHMVLIPDQQLVVVSFCSTWKPFTNVQMAAQPFQYHESKTLCYFHQLFIIDETSFECRPFWKKVSF